MGSEISSHSRNVPGLCHEKLFTACAVPLPLAAAAAGSMLACIAMRVLFQDFSREYEDSLRDGLLAACDRVFRSGHYILGQEVVGFEIAFAARRGKP